MNQGLTYVLHEHEALGVRDDLGGVKGLLKVVDELLLVTREVGGGALEELGGTGAEPCQVPSAALVLLLGAEELDEDACLAPRELVQRISPSG